MLPTISERKALAELDLTARSLDQVRAEIQGFAKNLEEFTSKFSSQMRNENALEVLLTASAMISIRMHIDTFCDMLREAQNRIQTSQRQL
jgi:hypothetical protein